MLDETLGLENIQNNNNEEVEVEGGGVGQAIARWGAEQANTVLGNMPFNPKVFYSKYRHN